MPDDDPLYADDFSYGAGVLIGQGGWSESFLGPTDDITTTGADATAAPLTVAGADQIALQSAIDLTLPWRIDIDVKALVGLGSGDNVLILAWNSNAGDYFWCELDTNTNGSYELGMQSSTQLSWTDGGHAADTAQWTTLSWRYDGTNFTTWLNGVQKGTNLVTGAMPASTDLLGLIATAETRSTPDPWLRAKNLKVYGTAP